MPKRKAKSKVPAVEPPAKIPKYDKTVLEQLKQFTKVVADTGDFSQMEKYKPEDATTNPTLILQAASNPKFSALIEDAIKFAKTKFPDISSKAPLPSGAMELILDRISVNFGSEILLRVPGLVSVEADARLSFNKDATISRAKKLIEMFKEKSISKDRILIKVAATWEGIQAAKELEKEGIRCNLTLVFNFVQAAACAEAGVTLISPFVGRILDWYKKAENKNYDAKDEPGVLGVTKIYNYFRMHGYKTVVMGASFRNIGEIINLAGCDKLTISPALLEELDKLYEKLDRKLDPENKIDSPKVSYDEIKFRWELNEDPMGTEKLSEGIRKFAEDTRKLEAFILSKIA